ncbi:sigma factor regulator N-terminal domain-containing protein [Streptococcus macedonicus]|uniref:sigma factor regulator N-terminal domain-containing protein n=1 Tax=Streptococcus macedonicus TaxID=59310 RepID=UPI00189B6D0C|nr:sigma factor regulator N-terminal domain-containing protein [Streptococcus macedonicus]MBF6977507.1 sigma factor regulator N-terminal domain-containing protein [Streptococcus macedonicus]
MTKNKFSDPLAELAKKRKRNTLFKTVLIALITVLLVLGITFKGLTYITSKNGQKAYNSFERLSEIAYPNISYDSLYYQPSGQFTGKVHADRYKDINGVQIPYSSFEENYSITGTFGTSADETSANNKLFDRGTRQKVPQFFNKNVKYEKGEVKTTPTNDLKYVNELNNDLVEIAITFDKPYIYKDIKKMIPSSIKQNWLWIGTSTKLDTSYWSTKYQFGTNPETLDTPQLFIDKIKENLKGNTKVYFNNVNIYSDLEKYAKKYENINNGDKLKFSGIILTGKAENFKQLEEEEWIYASSLGANIEYKPYYNLDKE